MIKIIKFYKIILLNDNKRKTPIFSTKHIYLLFKKYQIERREMNKTVNMNLIFYDKYFYF